MYAYIFVDVMHASIDMFLGLCCMHNYLCWYDVRVCASMFVRYFCKGFEVYIDVRDHYQAKM